MANYILKIIKDKAQLQERCDEIDLSTTEGLNKAQSIVYSLKEALREHKELVALSAPQLGYKYRIFCIKFVNGDIRAFINPLIFYNKGMHLSREVSIGLDDTEYLIPRVDEIHAAYQTPVAKADTNAFKGAVGEVFQQMTNLLDGILLEDLGLEILDGFDSMSEDDRKEVIELYLNSLKTINDDLKKHISETPELKVMDNAINFMTQLSTNQIETMPLSKEEQKNYEEAIAKDYIENNEFKSEA